MTRFEVMHRGQMRCRGAPIKNEWILLVNERTKRREFGGRGEFGYRLLSAPNRLESPRRGLELTFKVGSTVVVLGQYSDWRIPLGDERYRAGRRSCCSGYNILNSHAVPRLWLF